MNQKSRNCVFFMFTAAIISTCMGLMIYYSGFEHESRNAKNIFLAIVIVLFFQLLIGEPIKFLLIALDMSIWPRSMPKYRKYQDEEDSDEEYNRLNFLKHRLRAMRVQILITERYRNEVLTQEYKIIAQDLFLYGKYFLILIGVVLVSRDELLYYNTRRLNMLLMNNHSTYIGLKEVYHLNQLFDFVQSSLIDAFNYDANDTGVYSWVHSFQTKMVSVVRLRQLRLANEHMGWNDPEFTDQPYLPNWQLPYYHMHYAEKYWRIYEPWIPHVEKDFASRVLLNYNHLGKFTDYPELKGYVALLARQKENSMKILEFLTESHWLTYNTSAVFLDFTLYNVDADMFSVCTLRVEQTPFGGIIPDVYCDSIELVDDVLQTSYVTLVVLLIYVIVLLQFIHSFLVQLWYEPFRLRSMWNKLDLIIIVLNVAMIGVVVTRTTIVAAMLKRLEGANKLDFLDFRKPGRLLALANILTGFLICATTLRLWKVMQFARVFQIFTKTLYLAWKALAITALAITIILMAFVIAFVTINGNNSSHFVRPVKSVVTSMCFAFGFISEIKPNDLFHGGKYLGIVMYAALGFVIPVLLINVFVTLIHDYFTAAKIIGDAKFKRQITFLEFLRVEFNGVHHFIRNLPFCKRQYKRNNRTVAENIQRILDERDRQKILKARSASSILTNVATIEVEKDEETLQAEYREHIEHICAISKILHIQIEILERVIFDEVSDETKDWNKRRISRRPDGNDQPPDPQDGKPSNRYDSFV
ncbi:polycystin-2-like [Drosophila novamexicana]|uniref:polycystin-2-like n=1 Tax=Drosophila novamexicana TaxID=47314 RepID=UPI0011E597CC|nr:polycystin-2-like [Drosophila novamexicana]